MSSTPIPEEDDQDRNSDSEGSWSSGGRKMNGGPPDTSKMNGGPHQDDKEKDEDKPDDGGSGTSAG